MPTFVYDDDCGFCAWWATVFAERSDMEIVGFSETTAEERERLPDDWEDCAHLLTGDGVHSCGAAIEEALVHADLMPADLFNFLGQFADYERWREDLYEWGADRRDLWGLVLAEEPPTRRNG